MQERAAAVGNVRHAHAHDVLGGTAVDARAGKVHFAFGAHHCAERAQGRGLARAVRAEQRGDRAFLQREVDAVEHTGLAVGGAQAADVKQCQGRP